MSEVPRMPQDDWRPYDAAALERLGVPDAAVAALTGRGLPVNAGEYFVRVPERELEVAELPECGRAAFLGQHEDGWNNTYWLSLADGSVWMRYGLRDEPAHHVKRINTSVAALQAMLGVWSDYANSDLAGDDENTDGYTRFIESTILRAVGTDPESFEDPENWWPITLEQIESTMPGILLGDKWLYEHVRRDESGQFVLDHPGYEDDDL